MAVLSGATASGRQFCQVQAPTSATSYYTAPSNNSNVTSPSATAYIKEIIICNTSGTAVTATISVGGGNGVNNIISGLSINPNDTKILSGLNTMIPAGQSIFVWGNTASALSVTISGVEVN